MYIPEGMTEGEILAAIERQVNAVAPSFPFGIFGVDDVKQEARKFAMEALEKYDTKRPLDNFLYRHIKNRLINLKRNKFRRTEPSCPQCANGEFCEGEVACKRHTEWLKRNQAKASLMRPVGMDSVPEERIANLSTDGVEMEELLREIDSALPIELRATYLRLLSSCRVSKAKKEEVQRALEGICRQRRGE